MYKARIDKNVYASQLSFETPEVQLSFDTTAMIRFSKHVTYHHG
jgi:hypothetical protein